MSKKLLAFVILASLGVVVFGWMSAGHSVVPAEESAAEQQGLIVISDIASFKKLQEPPVVFNHTKHVTALEQEGCAQCHPYDEKDKERINFQFPKVRNERCRRELLNAYHNDCVGCHNERLKQGKKAGPIACGECHTPDRPEDWIKPVTFHYGIHYKHEKAMEKKCEGCHHIYDEEQKKLIYKEETESSCRDCHRSQDEENRREYRKVAHADCVNCHLQKGNEGKNAGPTGCEKCHFELKVPAVKELADIPRPDRKQPKTTLIKAEGAGTQEVFFDHENHQMNTITCRTCHHETMNACDTCHTLKGSADGAEITLEEAYHRKTSSWSCNGCHTDQKTAVQCSGCHLLMRTDEMSKKVCVVCHTGPVESSPEAAGIKDPEELIPANTDAEMKISALEGEYEPSKFPHLEIVKKLTKTSNETKLSRKFHVEEVTMCQGCHHASAVEPKAVLPKCGSCHKATLDLKDLSKPRLLAVYHLQCLGCHEKMNLKEQGCTDCHADKEAKRSVSEARSEAGSASH